ncbi:MAG: tRNA (adenosine(37)-N6)-dimethylallyltransferase MiaA [Rubrivivax sp.]
MPAQRTQPVIAIAGPTASGKSAAALAVARALVPARRVEVISVDSALVYRGLDIGTAKPTVAEQAEVPHHLIDLIDPTQAYSAARFVADARRLMDEIEGRGALPLLVGGTMLYLKALRDGLDAMPAANPAVRAALDAQAAERGWPALHAELTKVDPVTAARLPPHDAQRIQRALEVWELTGRPLSDWHGQASGGTQGVPLRLIALEPHSRAWLHERIAQRFDAMLAAGLMDEVRALKGRGDLRPDLPSMRCVGYRQAWEALDKDPYLQPGAPQWPAFRDAGIAATRQLAKRQLTWLRSMTDRQVVVCDAPGLQDRVIEAIRAAG